MHNQHFIIRSKDIRRNAAEAVAHIAAEPLMEVIIREYRKSKTQEQLGYLWGVVLPTIQKHIEDSTGDHYTTDDIYAWMIDEYGQDRVVTINGKPKVVKLTASKMNTAEMSEFIDSVIRHAAAHMGLVVPDAAPGNV